MTEEEFLDPYIKEIIKQLLEELYEECAHGDEKHRMWLKNKFDTFYKDKYENN